MTIGRDHRVMTLGIRGSATHRNADQFSCAGVTIVQKHVTDSVRIPRDEVRRLTLEHDVAAIGRDRRIQAVSIALNPCARSTRSLGYAVLAIAYKDIIDSVCVPGNE